MYVHIGKDSVINSKDIIGIFDIDNTSISKKTVEFLKISDKNKNIINVCSDIPKSFIVTNNNKNNFIYITQIAPSTIKKRLNNKDSF